MLNFGVQFYCLGHTFAKKKKHRQLQTVQQHATRFITGDYSSREQGCVTQMLQELALPSLQDRRKMNRLVLVPALQCHDVLTPVRSKRHIKTRQFKDLSLPLLYKDNLQTIQSVLNLCSAIQKSIVIRSSQRQWLIGIILRKVLCAQRQLTASEEPSHTGTENFPQLSPRCAYVDRICNVHIQIQIQ